MFKGKKIKVLIAMLSVLLMLTACGAPAVSEPAAPANTEPANEAPVVEAPEEGAAPSGDPLRLGVIAPITGASAFSGEMMSIASTLAVEQMNAAGGIQGHPVELLIENDNYEAATCVAAAEKLTSQDNVHFVCGPIASSTAAAVQIITDEAKVPHIIPSGSAAALTREGTDWFFRLTLADVYQTAVLADLVANQMGFSNVAILAESASHGEGTIASWERDLEPFGIVPTVERFEDSDIDFSAQVTKVKGTNPDCVIVAAASVGTGATILKQAREVGIDAQFIISSAVAGSNDFCNLAGEAAEGAIGTSSFLSNNPDPVVQKFVEDFTAASGKEPEGKEAAQLYDAFMILNEYLNQKNDDGTYKYPLEFTAAALESDRAMIREALTNVKAYHGATGLDVNFGPEITPEDRDGLKQPLLITVKGGQWEAL